MKVNWIVRGVYGLEMLIKLCPYDKTELKNVSSVLGVRADSMRGRLLVWKARMSSEKKHDLKKVRD